MRSLPNWSCTRILTSKQHNHRAVSYTHLDVYKRQVQLLPSHDAVSLITVLPEQLQSPLLTAEWEYRPVSYTHLDVYKRQLLHRRDALAFEGGTDRCLYGRNLEAIQKMGRYSDRYHPECQRPVSYTHLDVYKRQALLQSV